MSATANMKDPLRLLIVDDHPVVTRGLRAMLMGSNVEIVGEASDGLKAVESASELEPDVILMDVRMPNMDGLTATRLIKETNSRVVIVMLTSFENRDYLREAVEAGAAGYVLKGLERSTLLTALGDVVSGSSLFDPAVLVDLLKESGRKPEAEPPIQSLTKREEAVLSLISAGKTNKQIAATLSFSIGAIKKTVQDIISKMGVTDRTQAAVEAVRTGWVPHDGNESS